MKASDPTLRSLGQTIFRVILGTLAALTLLWIAVVGLAAAVLKPYFLAVYWFLGLVGLLVCVAGFASAFPGRKGGDNRIPHPLRATACITGAFAIGAIFWTQATPFLQEEKPGLEIMSLVVATTTMVGILGLLALSAFLRATREGDEGVMDESAGMEAGLGVSS